LGEVSDLADKCGKLFLSEIFKVLVIDVNITSFGKVLACYQVEDCGFA